MPPGKQHQRAGPSQNVVQPKLETKLEFEGAANGGNLEVRKFYTLNVRNNKRVITLLQSLILYLCRMKCCATDENDVQKLYKTVFPLLTKQLKIDRKLWNPIDLTEHVELLHRIFAPIKFDNVRGTTMLMIDQDSNFFSKNRFPDEVFIRSNSLDEDFEYHRTIGKGAFGRVTKVRNKLDGMYYAVKTIRITKESFHKSCNEVLLLSKLNHQNIVRYHTSWIEEGHSSAVLDSGSSCSTSTDASVFDDNSDSLSFIQFKHSITENTTIVNATEQISVIENEAHGFLMQDVQRIPRPDAASCPLESQQPVSCLAILGPKISNLCEMPENTGMAKPQFKGCKSKIKAKASNHGESTQSTLIPTNYIPISSRGSRNEQRIQTLALNIQMELCHGTLRDWLDERNFADNVNVCDAESKKYFKQILKAVEYVHKNGVIHRDLKPSNIFFNENHDDIKIGDFGLACQSPNLRIGKQGQSLQALTSEVGTHHYMSPEMLASKRYSQKTDIYSLGVILYELYVPFKTIMEANEMLEKLRSSGTDADLRNKWDTQINMIEKMISSYPDVRPEASNILESELFISKAEIISKQDDRIKALEQTLCEKKFIIAQLNKKINRFRCALANKDRVIANQSLYLAMDKRDSYDLSD